MAEVINAQYSHANLQIYEGKSIGKNIKLKLAEFERQKTSLAGLQSTLLGMQGDESPLLISQPSNTPRSLPPTERRMSLGTGPTECGNEAAGMMPFWMPGYSIGQPDYNLNPFPGSITPIEGEGNSPANLAVDEPPYPRNAEPCVSFGSILQRVSKCLKARSSL